MDDSAVSSVIGVILMVAITITLASIVSVHVLNWANEAGDESPEADISVEYSSNEITVAQMFNSEKVVVVDDASNETVHTFTSIGTVNVTNSEEVNGIPASDGDKLQVIAVGENGRRAIVQIVDKI